MYYDYIFQGGFAGDAATRSDALITRAEISRDLGHPRSAMADLEETARLAKDIGDRGARNQATAAIVTADLVARDKRLATTSVIETAVSFCLQTGNEYLLPQ